MQNFLLNPKIWVSIPRTHFLQGSRRDAIHQTGNHTTTRDSKASHHHSRKKSTPLKQRVHLPTLNPNITLYQAKSFTGKSHQNDNIETKTKHKKINLNLKIQGRGGDPLTAPAWKTRPKRASNLKKKKKKSFNGRKKYRRRDLRFMY